MPKTEKDLVDLLASLLQGADVIYLEKVGGFAGGRGQPGSAMFEFGKWATAPLWIALCYQVRVVQVTPQKWQKLLSLGVKKGKDSRAKTIWKNKLKSRAQQLFPGVAVTLKTADALLILEAARILEK